MNSASPRAQLHVQRVLERARQRPLKTDYRIVYNSISPPTQLSHSPSLALPGPSLAAPTPVTPRERTTSTLNSPSALTIIRDSQTHDDHTDEDKPSYTPSCSQQATASNARENNNHHNSQTSWNSESIHNGDYLCKVDQPSVKSLISPPPPLPFYVSAESDGVASSHLLEMKSAALETSPQQTSETTSMRSESDLEREYRNSVSALYQVSATVNRQQDGQPNLPLDRPAAPNPFDEWTQRVWPGTSTAADAADFSRSVDNIQCQDQVHTRYNDLQGVKELEIQSLRSALADAHARIHDLQQSNLTLRKRIYHLQLVSSIQNPDNMSNRGSDVNHVESR